MMTLRWPWQDLIMIDFQWILVSGEHIPLVAWYIPIYSWTSPMMMVRHGRDAKRRAWDELSHWTSPWMFLSCNSTMILKNETFSGKLIFPFSLLYCKLLKSLSCPWWHSSDHEEIWSCSVPDGHVSPWNMSFCCMIIHSEISLKSFQAFQCFLIYVRPLSIPRWCYVPTASPSGQ